MCFRITRCCCFPNTKDGSFAVGVYTLIISLLSTIVFGVLYGQVQNVANVVKSYPNSSSVNESVLAYANIYLILCIVLSCIWFLVGFCLVYGAKTDQRHFLIPWLIWMVMVIAGEFLTFICSFIVMIQIPSYAVGMLVSAAFISFHIYCYGCVYSQYKLLTESDPSQTTMKKF
ncbi:uncharacterized protein LOC111636195 [Centruroides sculpturatus]|uniref:uncharacterized protein LOC111636195 n=1 Tax=Centruroides sculpturatus TaxID=218467 RepID=UPI000C6EB35D|nr:uncharacterized protein LOC111636195 [Centruroides sculpturatus]